VAASGGEITENAARSAIVGIEVSKGHREVEELPDCSPEPEREIGNPPRSYLLVWMSMSLC
jgi:hypothetical protein